MPSTRSDALQEPQSELCSATERAWSGLTDRSKSRMVTGHRPATTPQPPDDSRGPHGRHVMGFQSDPSVQWLVRTLLGDQRDATAGDARGEEVFI
jgi:hypothetical protein